MFRLLGLFDPGWRDFSVRQSNTEITLLWILAVILGAGLYYFFFARNKKDSKESALKSAHLEKELSEERSRHTKLKQQLESANAKANSFASSATELEKVKHKVIDLQKEVEILSGQNLKLKDEFSAEHAKVTSMMVDHSEVESLRNRVKNQEKELIQMRNDVLRAKAELEKTLSEKVRLAASLDESQVTELKNKVQRLENDLHTSRLLVVKFQTEANVLEDEKKKLREEENTFEEKSKELDSFKAKIAQLEGDMQKSKQALSEQHQLKQKIQAEVDNWKNEAEAQAKNAAQGFDFQSKAAALDATVKKLQQENAMLNEKLSVAANDHLNAIASSAESTHLQSQVADLKLKSGMLESDLVTLRQNFLILEEKYSRLQTEKSVLEEQLSMKAITAMPVKPDDLARIEGIGPKLEALLNSNSIYTYSQLAATAPAALQAILTAAGEHYRIHDPSTWPEQAKLLNEGKFEAFDQLTLELKGGRRV
jgi:predicted flap endonuclease-1-like 5' DNA nuclease